MSVIDTTNINALKPNDSDLQTQDLRDNFAAINTAISDINTISKTSKAATITSDPIDGAMYFIDGTDGGWFKGVTGAAAATYTDNGASYCGTQFIPTGGDGSAAWVRVDGGYNVGLPYNPKWFGVDDTGATDTSTEIDALITAAPSGGKIHFYEGTYLAGSVSNITKRIHIDLNPGAILKLPANTDSSILRFHAGADGSSLRGGQFDGNQSNQTTRDRFGGLILFTDVNSSDGYICDGVKIYNSATGGIYIGNASNVTVINCHVENVDRMGIYAVADDTRTVTGTKIISNTIDQSAVPVTNVYAPCINITQSTFSGGTGIQTDYIIQGNKCKGVGTTTTVNNNLCIGAGGDRGIIQGNHTENGYMGISVGLSSDISIVGNTIYNAKKVGIEPAHVNELIVSGNTINGNSLTEIGVWITGLSGESAGKNIITNNSVKGCTGQSIQSDGMTGSEAERMIINNNILKDKGITLLDSSYTTINGNNLYGDASGSAVKLNTTDNVVISGNMIQNFTYIVGCTNPSATTVTDITVTGNNWGSTPTSPFVDLNNTTFGARCTSMNNSPPFDILDEQNNIKGGVITGSPEGALTAGVGSTVNRINGGTGLSFYVKETGTGNTGWVAK